VGGVPRRRGDPGPRAGRRVAGSGRPGGGGASNWREMPNFFNPYWGAKLSPIGQYLRNLYDRYVGGNIRMEEGNIALRAGVNLIRNFLGDVFFHVVTSVMTH